ncbi:hypothetical protein [Amycolatopsis sp. NPDC102389]|uniref:hypothetical protein n=1 Tax=Amycolatopsis sp. NPDC102389 TaxID=3363941 RepID=UPI003811E07C
MAKVTYADLKANWRFTHHGRKYLAEADAEPLGNGLVRIKVMDWVTSQRRTIRTAANGTPGDVSAR